MGMMRGLAECGVEVVAVPVEPGRLLRVAAKTPFYIPYLRSGRTGFRRARRASVASPGLAWVNTRTVSYRLHALGQLDGLVQVLMGTGYQLAPGIPVVTFADITVPQLKSSHYQGWDILPQRTLNARIALERKAYQRALAICLTSPWAAQSVLDVYGVEPEKVHVVGIGPNHTLRPVKRDWSVPHFLFVGFDWRRKNGPAVLRSFARLREEVPAATLDLVGGHPSVDQPGVTGHGRLQLDVPEHRSLVEELFARATCFVMPSLSEAVGIPFVEAGTAGLPSIGPRSGGSKYLIGNGGLTVEPNDDDALLQAMRRLSNGAIARELGAAAERRSRFFTWPQVGRRLLDALEGKAAEPFSRG